VFLIVHAHASETEISSGHASADDAHTTGQLIIEAPHQTALEGTEATFRIRRTDTSKEEKLTIELGGSATYGKDYKVEGLVDFSDGKAEVVFAKGQAVVIIAVDIEDDVVTEPNEGITFTITPSSKSSSMHPRRASLLIAANDTLVTNTHDQGEGSLRQAIINANSHEGMETIRFDSLNGPFAEPQTIILESELPPITGELAIDGFIEDRLWKATGVTLSGREERRILKVSKDGILTIRYLTISEGFAETGGGVLNEGTLHVEGVTFLNNTAKIAGGGLANTEGKATVINATFSANRAGERGGGMAVLDGKVLLSNNTFADNESREGSGLYNEGNVRLSNTILANNLGEADCHSTGVFDADSRNNLIVYNKGCDGAVSNEDPRLGEFGRYNGPTMIYPINGDSPAINAGDNSSAVDHEGNPLVWDQRGNGDPRFVAGITDIGAFEHQRNAWLVVDTYSDKDIHRCSRLVTGDCSLRGVIRLANADGKDAEIKFDPEIFKNDKNLVVDTPLPSISANMVIDGSDIGGISMNRSATSPLFSCKPGISLTLIRVILPDNAISPDCIRNEK
jgi:hypothetical protein